MSIPLRTRKASRRVTHFFSFIKQVRQAIPYRLLPQADRSVRYPRVHPYRLDGPASFPSERPDRRGGKGGRRRCRRQHPSSGLNKHLLASCISYKFHCLVLYFPCCSLNLIDQPSISQSVSKLQIACFTLQRSSMHCEVLSFFFLKNEQMMSVYLSVRPLFSE